MHIATGVHAYKIGKVYNYAIDLKKWKGKKVLIVNGEFLIVNC